jgi:hypothetical protein
MGEWWDDGFLILTQVSSPLISALLAIRKEAIPVFYGDQKVLCWRERQIGIFTL